MGLNVYVCIHMYIYALSLFLLSATGGLTPNPPQIFKPFAKATNPVFNTLMWLDKIPVGSTVCVSVMEVITEVEGLDCTHGPPTFCHGTCRVCPWDQAFHSRQRETETEREREREREREQRQAS